MRTRSPRAAQRRRTLKWLRILADSTRVLVSRWNVSGSVFEPDNASARPWRARALDEYPENDAESWLELAHAAHNLSAAWDRLATHAAEQARVMERKD